MTTYATLFGSSGRSGATTRSAITARTRWGAAITGITGSDLDSVSGGGFMACAWLTLTLTNIPRDTSMTELSDSRPVWADNIQLTVQRDPSRVRVVETRPGGYRVVLDLEGANMSREDAELHAEFWRGQLARDS